MQIKQYLNAAFPAIAVETVEEERFQGEFLSSSRYSISAIDASGQLTDIKSNTVIDRQSSYPKSFEMIASRRSSILLTYDWHHICHNAGAYRSLKRLLAQLKANGSCIVLIAPEWKLPPELVHDVPVLEYKLPDRNQLKRVLSDLSGMSSEKYPKAKDYDEVACVDAATGLTLTEAENAYALALTECSEFDSARIEQEKTRLIKSSGYLEVSKPVPIEMLGGCDELKSYFTDEVVPVKDDPELMVKGILLMGPPGTGKSLASKVAASILRRPLLRLDVSNLKGSLVGMSESNTRHALKLVDAVAPAVLWIEECEKAFAGHQSSGYTDSGVTSGMLGIILTWMQERTSNVFVVATCNEYNKLPPELTRAGRFDERFFVDLPIESEREAIAKIHLSRLGCDAKFVKPIATSTDGWTGAEIEQLVKSAARRTNRKLTKQSLEIAGHFIKPISRVRAQEIDALRSWAKDTLRIANTQEIASTGRKLSKQEL